MSSATSTNVSTSDEAASGFRPWQFFLLAGMLAATATVIVATGQSPASIVLLSLTVVAASFVGLGVYRSLAPFVSPESVQAPTLLGGRTRAALEREKALALRSIKELEFDFAMGKVAQADFDEMGSRLRARAIRMMRQLEAGEGYRQDIERALAVRLKGVVPAKAGTFTEEPEATGFSRGASIATTTACFACGTANDPDARFCKNCGSKIDLSGPG
jgi:hypothetical protein